MKVSAGSESTRLTIVNSQTKFERLALREPVLTGYLHLAAVIEPTIGRTPIPRHSSHKARLISRVKVLAAGLTRLDAVTSATVYSATLIPPPGRDARGMAPDPARYDVAVLIETVNIEALSPLQATVEYQNLHAMLTTAAKDFFVMPARCARMVAEVDKSRQGLFLFNYFVADDPEVALVLWEHLAGWYAAETGMNNSTLLAPLGASDYVLVNHARWDRRLAGFMISQFAKPSFHRYVRANLRANHTASIPILFHLA